MLIFFPRTETRLNFAFFSFNLLKISFSQSIFENIFFIKLLRTKVLERKPWCWAVSWDTHGWIHVRGSVRSLMLSTWFRIFSFYGILRTLSFFFLVYGSFYDSHFSSHTSALVSSFLQQGVDPGAVYDAHLLSVLPFSYPVAILLLMCLPALCADGCICERGKSLNRFAVC